MKFRLISPIVIPLCMMALVMGCGGPPSVNFGDGSVGNLVWGVTHNAYETQEPDKALLFADRAVEVYGEEARTINASLSEYPPTDPPESVYKYKPLNEVGFVLYTKGTILLERGDKEGAAAAFQSLVDDYHYAQFQVWDKPEEWWKPAEEAKKRLAELESGDS
ncbi:MAG: hypothetical protein HKN20_15585 [Gemmatimonadetes bacterium]|nr:hypothetical protein [Gemmatimonadota bacterium]